jgi:hypothetical protein
LEKPFNYPYHINACGLIGQAALFMVLSLNITMKPLFKKLAIAAGIVLAAAVLPLIFLARSPVLVVTDVSFGLLYDEARIRDEARSSSLALFRRVKPVVIADDAGEDIIQFAIAEISPRPYSVIFPFRYAGAARLYREQNPAVPVILMEGRYAENENPAAGVIGGNTDDYFLFKTDINADFYTAGLAAAAIDGGKNGKIVVFMEHNIQNQSREAFLKALNDNETPLQTSFFTAYTQFSQDSNLSCVVLTGAGAEYFEKNSGVPVIFLSWISPAFVPNDVVVIFNDSPWAQAVPAVRMAAAKMTKGQIPSKRIFLPGKSIDKAVLKNLKKLL